MIHMRVDGEVENSKQRMLCGVGPDLPDGDKYVFESEYFWHGMIDCPGCGGVTRPLGTPISKIATQPHQKGYAEWLRISRSWGCE